MLTNKLPLVPLVVLALVSIISLSTKLVDLRVFDICSKLLEWSLLMTTATATLVPYKSL
jgi:hypothetical protein